MVNHQELPKWFFVLGWILILSSVVAFFSEGTLIKRIVLIFIALNWITLLSWLVWRNTH